MAVLGAGEDEGRVRGMHAEGPEGRVGWRVLQRRGPGAAAVGGAVDAAARARRAVADGDQQRVLGARQRLDGARVVHAVEARARGLAGPGARAVGAGVDRVHGQHEVGLGLRGAGRQDGQGVDVAAGDAAGLGVDAFPGLAQVAAAPGAAFLDAEPDVAAVVGVEDDAEDARPVHAAAELGDLDAQALPGGAPVGGAEHRRARGRARAREQVARVARVDGQCPHRHAVGRRGQAREVRPAVGGDADAGVGAGIDARRVLRIDREGAHDAVEFDRLLQPEAVPARAVVDAAQDALPRGADQDGALHGGAARMRVEVFRGRCRA